MIQDEKRVREIYEFILKKYPTYLEAYHAYCKFLNKKGELEAINKTSQKAMELSEHNSVPTSMWVETRILRAKTYLKRSEIEKAISTLKDICYILPPFPGIEELPFIESVLTYGHTEDLFLSEIDEEHSQRRVSEAQKYMSFAKDGSASRRDYVHLLSSERRPEEQQVFEYGQADD